jgi:hypothetical protein
MKPNKDWHNPKVGAVYYAFGHDKDKPSIWQRIKQRLSKGVFTAQGGVRELPTDGEPFPE